MLGPTNLDFIRYFYCTCLTRSPDFLSRFRNLAGATQRIKIDQIESQVAPAEEAGRGGVIWDGRGNSSTYENVKVRQKTV